MLYNIDISEEYKSLSYPYNIEFYDGDLVLGNVYNIIKSSDNNFVGVWADSNALSSFGKMYVSNSDSFSIVNLGSNKLDDYYTQTHKGRSNETLSSAGVVDINVGG